ncbi:hypothetical protein ACKI16_30960 [Streptomyces scabiei]|uniref:hypothetical protein n=1 Tax=Streptomyces scabiei TaxID=1930 RepID=UPI0038F5DB5E
MFDTGLSWVPGRSAHGAAGRHLLAAKPLRAAALGDADQVRASGADEHSTALPGLTPIRSDIRSAMPGLRVFNSLVS